jgi:ribosome-associated heat shock protein Hsp15
MTDTADIRIDKWLWAARFFKTRSLASDAVQSGKIKLNQDRPKPAKGVRIGDRLEIRTLSGIFVVTVTGLSDRRGSATVAAELYKEDPESQKTREALRARMRAEAMIRPYKGRPTKRERRQMMRFTLVE